MRWRRVVALAVLLGCALAWPLEARGATAGALKPRIPETTVVDQTGRALSFSSDLLQGRTVAINFVFTSCKTICSPLTATFRRVQVELGDRVGRDVGLISITVDPATDSPERLKAYAAKFDAGPGWSFVTGEKAEIGALLKAFGVPTGSPAAHTPTIVVGNAAGGHWRRAYGLSPPSAIAAMIREAAERVPAAALPLTPAQERGREIYRRGAAAGETWTATIGGEGAPVPAASFACAGCHGLWGEGASEGGLQAPPLGWARLAGRAVSPLTGRARGPYGDETLRRAIVQGVDPSGARLHPGMPRYQMPPARVADLVAYLARIGDDGDNDPGVTPLSIRVGAALPLSGPSEAIGRSAQAMLAAVFDRVNAGGGVYGRRLDLVIEDAAGGEADARGPTRRLIERDRVFALVGSLHTGGEAPDADEVPLVGPLAISPRARADGPPIFYVLPSHYDQARALIDFALDRWPARSSRLTVVYADTAVDRDALAGVRHQAHVRGLAPAVEVLLAGRTDGVALVATLAAARPDVVLFFGDAGGLVALGGEMRRAGLEAGLLACVSTAGGSARHLPPEIAARTFFAAPTGLPEGSGGAEFASLLRNSPSPRAHVGVQMAAFAAGKVLVEGLRLSGRRLSRAGLVAALERIQHLETGVTPPLSFRASRIGAAGAAIMAVDPERMDLAIVRPWLSPK
jgi:ABC-type branched-subunit amino acid transport system substrate-binding protein/cytochrome oxidase Cu insertion factor (SCO1/SenC/PrrC family)